MNFILSFFCNFSTKNLKSLNFLLGLADAKKNALNSVDQNEVENRRQRRYVPSGRFEIQRPFQGEFPRAYFAGNANISAAIDPRVLTEHQRRIPAIDGVTQSTGGVEHLTGNSELGSEKQSQTGVAKLVQVRPLFNIVRNHFVALKFMAYNSF